MSAEALRSCLATLEALRAASPDDPARVAVERAAAHLNKSAKQKRRLARKQENRRVDRAAMARSERAAAYFDPGAFARGSKPLLPGAVAVDGADLDPEAFELGSRPQLGEVDGADDVRELRNRRHCYVCKQPFRRLHAFYHALCVACGERNYAARKDSADLTGRRAIVTGGRIKIGFEIAMSLWRAGADVVVTTRFPRDAEQRFREAGVSERVTVVGLDFLDIASVLRWIDRELGRGEPFEILINNAAQTVRRPPAYYARLAAAEARIERELAAGSSSTIACTSGAPTGEAVAALADEAVAVLFPDRVDAEGKPVDLRERNSWVAGASEVDPAELAEVHVVNAIVPFLIASRLRPLMQASEFADRYIVNVSAMEGVFAYGNKQHRHPHTNMAKAALNMFTRTSAAELAREGIYMNSVDTGWITQENPYPMEQRLKASGFCPPLDIVDGAARVLAPVYRGVRGERVAGAFFKDYEPAAW